MTTKRFCKPCKDRLNQFVGLQETSDGKLKCPKCGRIIDSALISTILAVKVRPEILKDIDKYIIKYIKSQLGDQKSKLYKLFDLLINPDDPMLLHIVSNSKFWGKVRKIELNPELYNQLKGVVIMKIVQRRQVFVKEFISDPKLTILYPKLMSLLKVPDSAIKEGTRDAILELDNDTLKVAGQKLGLL
jgi:hypothetical protein